MMFGRRSHLITIGKDDDLAWLPDVTPPPQQILPTPIARPADGGEP